MTVYSHSQLSTYEECLLKYKLCYRDKIKRDTEGVEGFLGNMVHEALKKCYDDAKLAMLNTLDELLAYCKMDTEGMVRITDKLRDLL